MLFSREEMSVVGGLCPHFSSLQMRAQVEEQLNQSQLSDSDQPGGFAQNAAAGSVSAHHSSLITLYVALGRNRLLRLFISRYCNLLVAHNYFIRCGIYLPCH